MPRAIGVGVGAPMNNKILVAGGVVGGAGIVLGLLSQQPATTPEDQGRKIAAGTVGLLADAAGVALLLVGLLQRK